MATLGMMFLVGAKALRDGGDPDNPERKSLDQRCRESLDFIKYGTSFLAWVVDEPDFFPQQAKAVDNLLTRTVGGLDQIAAV